MIGCTPDPAAARALFSRRGHLQGAIFCALFPSRNALVWLPTGWHCGTLGALRPSGIIEQRVWLKACREAHPWPELLAAIDTTRRTWEGWEQGRLMPGYAVYALAVTIEARNAAK